jgi:hypothetical protein
MANQLILYRIPVQTIHINTTTPRKPSVSKAIVGAVTALLLVVGILAFILWHRRRQNTKDSSATSTADMRSVSGIQLTPFTLTHLDATHGEPEP